MSQHPPESPDGPRDPAGSHAVPTNGGSGPPAGDPGVGGSPFAESADQQTPPWGQPPAAPPTTGRQPGEGQPWERQPWGGPPQGYQQPPAGYGQQAPPQGPQQYGPGDPYAQGGQYPQGYPQSGYPQGGHTQSGYPQGGYDPRQQYPPGYPPQQYQGQPPVPGPQAPLSVSDEKLWSTLSHISIPFIGVVGPLIVYLLFKDRGPFVRANALESLNFSIVYTIAQVVCSILTAVVIGSILLPIVFIGALILCVLAAVAANKGQLYAYPVNWRLIT